MNAREMLDAFLDESAFAERTLAATATLTPHGCDFAHTNTGPGDYWDPRCWNVIEAAHAGGWRVGEGEEHRTLRIAEAAGVWPAELRSWTDRTPILADGGRFCSFVKDCADRRRRLFELVERIAELIDCSDLSTTIDELLTILEAKTLEQGRAA